jgi:uncharacterized protein
MAINLQAFQLILLRRPDAATEYDDETLDQIQRDHVAFYTAQRESGHVVTNGPVGDQSDEALRGISIFAMESLERARELASTDPAVRAGWRPAPGWRSWMYLRTASSKPIGTFTGAPDRRRRRSRRGSGGTLRPGRAMVTRE